MNPIRVSTNPISIVFRSIPLPPVSTAISMDPTAPTIIRMPVRRIVLLIKLKKCFCIVLTLSKYLINPLFY